MKNCILCNQPTNGSIGQAGIKWSCICQSCKDKEDKILSEQLKCQAKAMDLIFNPTKKEETKCYTG